MKTKTEKTLVNIAAILILPAMVAALSIMIYTLVGWGVLIVYATMIGIGLVLLLISYGIQIKLRREW